MKISIKTIKIILIVIFALIAIGSLSTATYLVWLTAFGVGWGGGKITFLELI